jgi:hypothetical protein
MATTTDRESILEELLASPAAQELVAKRAREVHERRAAIAAERARLVEQAARDLEDLDRAIAAAADADTQAEAAAIEARRALHRARSERARVSTVHDVARNHLDGEMVALADPRIVAFQVQLREAFESTTGHPVTDASFPYGEPNVAGRVRKARYSDAPSRRQRIAAIRAAQVACEALALEAIDGDELTERLDALRASIPLRVEVEDTGRDMLGRSW